MKEQTTNSAVLVCPICEGMTDTVQKRRANTAFVNDEENFIEVCQECFDEYCEYYAERWADYYADIRAGLYGA